MKLELTLAVTMATAPAAMGTYTDAMGDAQDTFGAGDPLLDIDALHILYGDASLFIEMTFHTPISAPSGGLADGLFGLIEFDVDQSVGTGGGALQNVFSPPFAFLDIGVDFVLDIGFESVTPGFAAVFDATTGELQAMVPIVYGPTSFTTAIPLSALGSDDGVLDFTTTIGTGPQPTDATDFVATSSAIPVPAGLALFGIAAVGRRRRRQ